MNSVILIGRLTAKPELSSTATGTNVCKFTLAVDGSKKDDTDFLDVTAFNKTAENLSQYKDKGDLIAVKGRLKKDVWKDNNGQSRSRTYVIAGEVQFLSSSKSKQDIQENLSAEEVDEIYQEYKDDLPF